MKMNLKSTKKSTYRNLIKRKHRLWEKNLKTFLTKLFGENLTYVLVHHTVQQQTNMIDCGVYEIAFSVTIVLRLNPVEQNFVVSKMSPHLLKIFRRNELLQFPFSTNLQSRSAKKKDNQRT